TSPATSLLVYDITEGRFYFYTGTQWSALNTFVQNSGSVTATHTGDVVINGTVTATSYGGLNVNGTVPPGGIIMWYGQPTSIPEGWALCDGTNNTPDLRERFIVGAGDNSSVAGLAYDFAQTGGAASITLTPEQLAPHTHATETFSRRGWPDGSDDRIF